MSKSIQRNKNWRLLQVKEKKYLINILTSEQLELDSSIKPTSYMFSLLDGRFSEAVVVEKFTRKFPRFGKKWVEKYLTLLRKRGIVERIEKKPKELTSRYLLGLDRQLDFLSELKNGKTCYENQLALKKARIAVLGLGSVSHYTILSLLASGVGFFRCVDFDIIEESNIGRQPIFRSDDVGKLKSNVVANFIRSSRRGTKAEAIAKMLQTEKDIEMMAHNCDVVIQSCDLPRFLIHRMINSVCLKLKKPNILLYSGRVGPFNIPYKTACYGCLETKLRNKFKLYDFLVDDINNSEFTRFPELAVVGTMSGTLAAKEIIGHLLGIKPETYKGFFDINPFTLKIEFHQLSRQGNCYACARRFK